MIAPAAPAPIDPARRQFLFGGALIATSALAVALTPRAGPPLLRPEGLEAAIPHTLGAWRFVGASGLVLPPPDETEVRTYDQVLTRVYTDGDGPPVMLLVAYGGGQTGLFAVHRPEACYPAQGYRLQGREGVRLPVASGRSVPGTFWTAESDIRTEQLLYWTRIGRDFPKSWAAEHVAVVRNNLARRLPDGVLVRMSMLSNDPAASLVRLEAFARALTGRVGPLGRRVLLGPDTGE